MSKAASKKYRHNSEGFIHLIPLLLVALFLVSVLVFNQSNNTKQTKIVGAVLNSTDDNSGSGSSSSGSVSSGSGSDETTTTSTDDNSGSSGSGSSDSNDASDDSGDDVSDDNSMEASEDRMSDNTSDEVEMENETETVDDRSEFRFSDSLRVKTREEADRSRVDIYEGGRKLTIRTRDGVTKITIENEAGEEIGENDFGNEDELEIGEQAQLRVRSRNGVVFLTNGDIDTRSDFPLTVDTESNELSVTTPAGTRVLTVLPQQAVDNMLAQNVIDRVLSTITTASTNSVTPDEEEEAELEVEDNELVYVIEGESQEKLFGLFGVSVPKTVKVSAESGELVGIDQSLLSRILDLISF